MSNNTLNVNGQAINMEDIQAALAAQGLDIRELAKQAKALQRGEIINPERKVVSSTVQFKLALVNYPDFCIERTTAKTRQLVVIMPSCKGYYMKSFKGEEEYVEELQNCTVSSLPVCMTLNFLQIFGLKGCAPVKNSANCFYVHLKAINQKLM